MTLLRTMFSTWYIGLIVSLILLVPVVKLLIFSLRALFWSMNAFQALVTGAPLPPI